MATDTSSVFADQVASITNTNDTLVIIGEGPSDAYLVYYCPCRIVKLRHLRDTNQVITHQVIARLSAVFDATIARGGRVFVVDQVIEGEAADLGVYDLLTLDVVELRSWLRSYTWKQHQFKHRAVFELMQ